MEHKQSTNIKMPTNPISRFLFVVIFISTSALAQVQQNWHQKCYAPHFRTINAVQILPSGRIIAAGGNESNDAITSLFYSDDSATTWNFVIDTIHSWVKDIHFPTADTGYAVGYNGLILKSVNAGLNWSAIIVPGNAGGRNYNGVHFVNGRTGIIVGGNQANDSVQTILRTTDGGQSWSVITDALGSWLLDVEFVNSNVGYTVGEMGKILYTSDGGQNWSTVAVPLGLTGRKFHGLHFFDSQTGIVVGGNEANDSIQTIIKTTDGGANWNIISDSIASMLRVVHFINANQGYVAGDDGVIKYTSDQGLTWTTYTITGNDTYGINDINFLNGGFGVAAGVTGKVFVYKNSISIGIAEKESLGDFKVEVYPNPSTETLILHINSNILNHSNGNCEILISNALGEVCEQLKLDNMNEFTRLDISKLKSQFYILTLITTNQLFTLKFAKK